MATDSRLKAERRLRVRHKVHTPAYATTNQNSSYVLPHLSEVVDISEGGLCFQNPSQMQPQECVELALDLSETKAHINAAATVVWSDPSGRTGLRFDEMSEESLHQLREWLLANMLVACANHVSFAGSLEAPVPPAAAPEPQTQTVTADFSEPEAPLVADHTSVLAAIAAIQREVELFGVDTQAALQLIAHRAQMLTRSSGAALALSDSEAMVCRASSGEAPPVGAHLQIGHGFSGECVRTGELLHCEDSETDPRVDRESCRALGVRSMIAAPVRAEDVVVGLLEVFAPSASAFSETDRVAVQNLAQIASRAVERGNLARAAAQDEPSPSESISPGEEPREPRRSGRIRTILIAAIVLASLALLGLSLIPRLTKAKAPTTASGMSAQSSPQAVILGFEGIKQRAAQGDPNAQYDLGLHYAIGDQVKEDQTEAMRWFAMAAEQGHVRAQSTMATHFWSGTGVGRDPKNAYFWALLARANGDETSKVLAPQLESTLTRAEIEETRQQANDWLGHRQLTEAK